MQSYVTLLSTASYLPGVLCLHQSLRKTGNRFPLLVAISGGLDRSIDSRLTERGMHVLRLPPPLEFPEALKRESGHWANTFDKLRLFDLPGFSKLVYLDSDMMVLKNIDELFDRPHMSAVAAGRCIHPDWIGLNSGLMVIVPEPGLGSRVASTLQEAVAWRTERGHPGLSDQDLINGYHPDWPRLGHLHLDEGYNMFFGNIDIYVEQHNYRFPENANADSKVIRVVHFVGASKPWMPWARLKYFRLRWRERSRSRWERQAFAMYQSMLSEA